MRALEAAFGKSDFHEILAAVTIAVEDDREAMHQKLRQRGLDSGPAGGALAIEFAGLRKALKRAEKYVKRMGLRLDTDEARCRADGFIVPESGDWGIWETRPSQVGRDGQPRAGWTLDSNYGGWTTTTIELFDSEDEAARNVHGSYQKAKRFTREPRPQPVAT
jgi:hypothetical protein